MAGKDAILASSPMTQREFASMGGKARAAKLTKKRMRQIARKAIAARWAKRDKK